MKVKYKRDFFVFLYFLLVDLELSPRQDIDFWWEDCCYEQYFRALFLLSHWDYEIRKLLSDTIFILLSYDFWLLLCKKWEKS